MNRSSFVVACCLAFLLITSFSSCDSSDGVHRKRDPQSPVRVLGGSITIRSKNPWADVGGCTGCKKTDADTSQILFDDDAAPRPLGRPWQLTIYAREKGGAANTNNGGILICSNYSSGTTCDPSAATPSSTLTAIPIPPSGGGSTSLTDKKLSDDRSYAIRYVADSSCKPCGGDFCEHPGKMTLSVKDSNDAPITCKNGECRIFIGKP
jgi:hypothetical protein